MVIVTTTKRPATVLRESTGERIERLRLQRGWTQRRLAETAGLNAMTVYRAESGGDVYAWVLHAIATALDETMDYVWDGSEAPS